MRPTLRLLCVTVAAVVMTACASTGAVPRPFPMPAKAPSTADASPPPASPAGPASAPAAAGRPAPDSAIPPEAVAEVHGADPGTIPTELPIGVIETALALLGSPYRNGGSTPDGFDCSGFTQWVFAQHGVALPRESREQYAIGTEIERGDVAAGDLIFFSTVARGPSHVGIALDADRFVHAPNTRGVVRVERVSSTYWRRRYIGARRLESEAPSAHTVN